MLKNFVEVKNGKFKMNGMVFHWKKHKIIEDRVIDIKICKVVSIW